MKKAGAENKLCYRPLKKPSNLCQNTGKVQVRPAVSVAMASSAAEYTVLDIARLMSSGVTSYCNKLKLIKFRTPTASVSMPSHQSNDMSHFLSKTKVSIS